MMVVMVCKVKVSAGQREQVERVLEDVLQFFHVNIILFFGYTTLLNIFLFTKMSINKIT